MKTKILKELAIILMTLAPLIYLLIIWKSLPEQVPMHYDLHGNIDDYGSKNALLAISIAIPAFVYVLFTIIPLIDPKGKIKAMGNKFYHLKFIFVLFISAISCFIIYAAQQNNSGSMDHFLFILLGLLFCFLGNYFQSIKPNYFIGIRTPWTLESELVWKETHKLAGRIWLVSGLLIIILNLALSPELFTSVFLFIVAVMVIIPVIFSYNRFKAHKNTINNG